MPSLSERPCTSGGTYGEKTWHLGLEQLVHSIWGAQSSRDISVNTVSKRESFREIAQTLAQPQMFTGLSPAPAAPPRCAGGGALLSPGPGRAGRRRASQESMAATASCGSGTPQPSSQRPPHGGHDALVITQEPRRSGGHTTAIARRPSCRSRHKDSCHTPFTRRCSMPRPGWGFKS